MARSVPEVPHRLPDAASTGEQDRVTERNPHLPAVRGGRAVTRTTRLRPTAPVSSQVSPEERVPNAQQQQEEQEHASPDRWGAKCHCAREHCRSDYKVANESNALSPCHASPSASAREDFIADSPESVRLNAARSAFLKERGCVKGVWAVGLIALSLFERASPSRCRGWSVGFAPGFVELGWAGSVCQAFLRCDGCAAWCVPATTTRAQAVSRPRREWRGSCRFRARGQSCPSRSRGLGQATDLAVA
jgi:hypothetical protein